MSDCRVGVLTINYPDPESYVRQPRFGSQDAAIWGVELKDK